jgi:hypothetical protein
LKTSYFIGCPENPDEKGKRCKSATTPVTVIEDAPQQHHRETGKVTVADES